MPDNSWSTFAEALLAVAAVIGVFGPIRWAIVAYIRALQASTQAKLADLPPEKRADLEAGPQ